MIYTANLIHKGVVNLDSLDSCHGPISEMEFGNNMAVLSGDFLLANASTGLADLRNTYVSTYSRCLSASELSLHQYFVLDMLL